MSSAAAQLPERLSFEAFESFLEARPGERWELIDGQPVLMVGVSYGHSLVAGNIYSALRNLARRRGCEVHFTEFFVSGGDLSGYLAAPDIFVRCGPLDDKAKRAEDPTIVVEVLSPSTIRRDRVIKFERYTRISSIRQIILTYQDEVRVESFVRDGDEWPMEVFTRQDEAVPLPSLDTGMALVDIYAGTALGRRLDASEPT